MAEERLGASFSIDVTDLKTGLAQANRLIRESESEFKAAAAGMDDWAKSKDGLKAKIKSLNDIVGVQKKKVGALKTEYKNLIDNGLDPASKEAVEFRTKINKEEAALKSNEKELRDQQQALKNLGKDADDAGNKMQKLGEMAKAAGKVAAAAIGAAAAGVVALTKSAIDNYAEYEQLVGGVDTLFGESSKKVQKYANNAFKTAGMSANEYMETVTSFSASLLQSLGGDTDKAASVADMAISDMADNANKMGTSMESIQNAYQGFAKQNYTMLDNLKLGYGGTKSEMERLLADATKLTGKSYNLNNLSDVYEAIHAVQNELGITGTTAKEASSTIQGSVSSMKSAWSNLMTGMANENADFDSLISQFIDSVATVAENLIPRIKVVLNGVVKLVAGLVPQIPKLLRNMLPEFIVAVMDLVDGLVKQAPVIVKEIVGIVPQIAKALIGMTPTIIQAIFTIISQLITAIAKMLPEIVQAVIDIIPQIIMALKEAFPQLMDAVIMLVMSLADCIPQLLNAIIDALPRVIDAICGFLNDAMPQMIEAGISLFMSIVNAIPVLIGNLLDKLPYIIETIVNTLLNNLPLIIDAAIQMFFGIIDAIPQIIKELIINLPKIIVTICESLLKAIPQLIEAGGQLLEGLFKGLLDPKRIWEAVKSLFEGIVGGIKKLFGIKSPSRVMADVVGKNLALGIGVGFKKNIKGVNQMIGDSMNFADSQGANGGSAVRGGGVVVYQTNNYSQAHSRYEIYKSKQQTASAVRLALAGV